jgi:hypothetical protein
MICTIHDVAWRKIKGEHVAHFVEKRIALCYGNSLHSVASCRASCKAAFEPACPLLSVANAIEIDVGKLTQQDATPRADCYQSDERPIRGICPKQSHGSRSSEVPPHLQRDTSSERHRGSFEPAGAPFVRSCDVNGAKR